MSQQGIPLVGPILNRIIGTRNERFVRKYTARVEEINALEPEARKLTDAVIMARLGELRSRIASGARADDLMAEAFSVAREAMDRNVGIRNILNPLHAFDAGRLPAAARDLFQRVKAEADAMAPADPAGPYLGCSAPVPGWVRVEIPLELYAAVRELYPESRPPFRARPFDVQLIGAMVLSQGKISEMKTGEGKTIVAPLAAYLACADHRRVHIVTVNDYLVQRDRDWTFPFFRALGLTVGAIHPQHQQPEPVKRQMYRCDVVYGTTSEFGFDYLRDNMKRSVTDQVQRRRDFAIVDEVDSILIDEARTPLIISGPAHEHKPRYELADQLARHLAEKHRPWGDADERVQACRKKIKGLEGDIRNARDKSKVPELQEAMRAAKAELPGLESARDQHVQFYEVKEERKSVHLTHDGIAEAQRKAGVGSFYVDENMDLPHLLEQALRAHAVYQLDRDYIVAPVPDPYTGRSEPGIVIVDAFTGRPMYGRQWSDGLHQAIECKEKVAIKEETQTVATITIQNFFKMYPRLAGMTGTADTEAQEFHDIYKLDVVSIPTNKPVVRRDFDDLMFLVGKDKWQAIADEIKAFHDAGRPILVGTTSVEKSESLARMLASRHQIRHEVLNAKQHEREAHIIENAGQLGAVMIATNMAGRGTDIKLGAISREQLLDHWLRRGLASRGLTTDAPDEALRENIYRKVAPAELGLPRRETDDLPFPELELRLLRHWAARNTWLSPKKIDQLDAESLRAELDATGRTLMHRLRWFESIEDMGGLHVVGTERHEARRIDNQLRGRGGRQGDKGSSRFFVALDDDLMKMFAGETTMRVLSRLGMKEGDAIEHSMLSKSVERAQRKVEERNFQYRKQVLEYDEVMEHQRRRFYGMRQRVLEGRDVKGLVLDEFVDRAIADAADEYLDRDYPASCAAEYAKEKLDCSVPPDRLRGKDRAEMEQAIRLEAKADARHQISLTLGEYMPSEGAEFSVDFDAAGLAAWARSRFGVELDPAGLRSGGADERRRVQDLLGAAAEAKIDAADLSGLDTYLTPDYGAAMLAGWANEKFGFGVTPDQISAAARDEANPPAELLKKLARDKYRQREIEYPVEFAMELTRAMMTQDRKAALQQLAQWASRRFRLPWTEESLRLRPPNTIRDELLAASREFVESGRLEAEIADALARTTDEALAAHLAERFGPGVTLPDWMLHLKDDDRAQAVRGRVESILRGEVLYLEQTILLGAFDEAWRDHLTAMQQMKDAIGFRAFSQQDPRIAFKREGANLFNGMFQTIRDRVTDHVFKVSVTPGLAQQAARSPRPGPRPPSRAPVSAGPAAAPPPPGPYGGSITGPGIA